MSAAPARESPFMSLRPKALRLEGRRRLFSPKSTAPGSRQCQGSYMTIFENQDTVTGLSIHALPSVYAAGRDQQADVANEK